MSLIPQDKRQSVEDVYLNGSFCHDESCFGEVNYKTDHFHLVLLLIFKELSIESSLAAAVSLPGVNYPCLMEGLCPRRRHSEKHVYESSILEQAIKFSALGNLACGRSLHGTELLRKLNIMWIARWHNSSVWTCDVVSPLNQVMEEFYFLIRNVVY